MAINNVFIAKPRCLEEEYRSFYEQKVDVNLKINFDDYLEPNEGGIMHNEHLFLKDRGVVVSTGTERSFFDLILSHSPLREGLVVRDISPRVKAYVDFNTLLLRIAMDRSHYLKLSSIDGATKEERIKEIEKLIENYEMPSYVKNYYRIHLQDFADVYYSTLHRWREESEPQFIHYHKNNLQFSILQQYAKEGNIIATIGDINDLEFLSQRIIPFIDISNIPDYTIMKLQNNNPNFHPLVIWTDQDYRNTSYYSYTHEETLPAEGKQEMDNLIEKLKSSGTIESNVGCAIRNLIIRHKGSELPDNFIPTYSTYTLATLKEYQKKNCIEGFFGIIDFKSSDTPRVLNKMTQDELRAVAQTPGIERFVEKLVDMFLLTPEVYCAFSEVKGWKEEFQKQASEYSNNPYVKKWYDKVVDLLQSAQ